jgi:hypothetical protein
MFKKLVAFFIFAFINIILADEMMSDACWIESKSRGVGVLVSDCAKGLEKSGLLCYPPCPSGNFF